MPVSAERSEYFRRLSYLRKNYRNGSFEPKHDPLAFRCRCEGCQERRSRIWFEPVMAALLEQPTCVNLCLVPAKFKGDLTGARIKAIRDSMRLTQAQFAQQVGTTTITVCRWERGKAVPHPIFRKRIYELSEVVARVLNDPERETPIDFTI